MHKATELTLLLAVAIRGGGEREMRSWFAALAIACPLWARQQDEYERRWGRQTTSLQPTLTPWRLMSQRPENEANTTDSPLAVARWYLELISVIPSNTAFNFES